MRLYQIQHSPLDRESAAPDTLRFEPSATTAAKIAKAFSAENGVLASVYFANVPTKKGEVLDFFNKGGYEAHKEHVVSFDSGEKLKGEPAQGAPGDEPDDPFADLDADPSGEYDPFAA